MAKQITWTTSDGKAVIMTLDTRHELDSQGYERGSRLAVVVSATMDGESIRAYHVAPVNHPVAVAAFGTIGLTQINYDRYLAALTEVEETIAQHNADIDTHEDELNAMTEAGRRIEKKMGR